MSNFQQKFYESLKDWLVRQGKEVDTVIGYDDSVDYGFACDTCGGDATIEVYIKYMINGDVKYFTYGGSFSEILRELV